MNSICYLTEFPWKGTDYEALLIRDEAGKACEFYVQKAGSGSLVGNIYTGKVERVLPQIGGAFVRIGEKQSVFLPLEDARCCIYTRKFSKREELCGGDELLIEIAKDPIKTKDAMATANLSFASAHLLLTTGRTQIGVSRKLLKEQAGRYREALASLGLPYGFVVRTGAKGMTADELCAEAEVLFEKTNDFLKTALHREACSLVRRSEHPFLRRAKKFLSETGAAGTVCTDLPQRYLELTGEEPFFMTAGGRLKNREKEGDFCTFYEDEVCPLYKVIGLPTVLERALAKKVYLSSGAYLVIEPTEALTVIDVNSGKKQTRQSAEEYYYQVNLEAAEEIARQLRLRNLSGMILVDFINLRSEEKCREVLTALRRFCQKDPVPVQVLDYTKLHLVEITRKREYTPLAQQIGYF